MPALPNATRFNDLSVTEQQYRDAMAELISYLRSLFGEAGTVRMAREMLGLAGTGSPNPRGAWSAVAAYAVNDYTTFGGAAYIAVNPIGPSAINPSADAANWVLMQGISAAALTDKSNAQNGSALVGHRGESAQIAIDQRNRELRLFRLKNALSSIVQSGTGRACMMIFGDSIARSLIPDEAIKELYRLYGWRGIWCSPNSALGGPLYSTGNLTGGTPSGATAVASRWSTSINGNSFSLSAAGHRVTFGFSETLQTGGVLPYVDRATLIFARRSGGGVFKIQTVSPYGGAELPQDVAGYTAVSTNNAAVDVQTVQVNFNSRAVGNHLSVLWQSGGEVEIVGCLLEDTTQAGGFLAAYYDQGGIDMENTNTMPQANLTTILSVIQPDLITWSMKDNNVGAKLAVFQPLWDGAYDTDWLFIAPYPDVVGNTEAQARAGAQPVIDWAISQGHDYYDPLLDCPSYSYAQAQGWMADVTHFNTKAQNTLGPRMFRSSGLLPKFNPGSKIDNVAAINVAALTVTLNNADLGGTLRKLRGQSIASARGVKIRASQFDSIIAEYASTPIGVGGFTMVAFYRVPPALAAMDFAGMRSGAGGGNGGDTMGFFANPGQSTVGISMRKSDNSGGVSYTSNAAYAALQQKFGDIVMVAARRIVAPASGVGPLDVFVDEFRYPLQGYAQAGADPYQNLTLSNFFKLGAVQGPIGAQDWECFGGALYLSPLTDAQILACFNLGDFVSGYDIALRLDEQVGSVAGRYPEKRGRLLGPTWLRSNVKPAQRGVFQGTAYTLQRNEDIINDWVANANRSIYTLPASPSVGDTISVTGFGQGGWRIAQPAGHQILEGAGTTVGTNATTAGAGGYVQSGQRYDAIMLRCAVADTTGPTYTWVVERRSGALTWV